MRAKAYLPPASHSAVVEMRQGTAWTEPGQGRNVIDIHDMVCGPDRWGKTTSDLEHAALAHLSDMIMAGYGYRHTNLRLTGTPLTADDLKRIAEAK